jgi:hypothetical protein
MSHFAVLVITDQKPTETVLAKALAPFHEFECTGIVNEYVQSVDQLQEAREEYAIRKERRFKAPDGTLFSPYDDQFYRDPTPEESQKIGPIVGTGCGSGLSWTSKDWGDGRGYRTKIRFKPDGFEEVELNSEDVRTFREFVEYYYERPLLAEGDAPDLEGEHKWGWYRINDEGEISELIVRTNPNKKWDWWVVGGRWSGFLVPKAEADARDPSDPDAPEKGRPWLMGSEANPAGVDVIRKGDVDFEAMRTKARREASAKWNKVREIIGPVMDGFVGWEKVLEELFPGDIDKAREFYHAQPAKKALAEAAKADQSLFWVDVEDFLGEHDPYVEQAGHRATVLFAVLKDGQWVERGQMGWWGCVSNENDHDTWDSDFNAMLDALPDDAWLTVVDCHI